MTTTVAGGLPFFITTVAGTDPSAEVVYETTSSGEEPMLVSFDLSSFGPDHFFPVLPSLLNRPSVFAALYAGGGSVVSRAATGRPVLRAVATELGGDEPPSSPTVAASRRLTAPKPLTPFDFLRQNLEQLTPGGWGVLFDRSRVQELLAFPLEELNKKEINFLFALAAHGDKIPEDMKSPLLNRLLLIAEDPCRDFESRAHSLVYGMRPLVKHVDPIEAGIAGRLLNLALARHKELGNAKNRFTLRIEALDVFHAILEKSRNRYQDQSRDWAASLVVLVDDTAVENSLLRYKAMSAIAVLLRHAGPEALEFLRPILAVERPGEKESLRTMRHIAFALTPTGDLKQCIETSLKNLENGVPKARQFALWVLSGLWLHLLEREEFALASRVFGGLTERFVSSCRLDTRSTKEFHYREAMQAVNHIILLSYETARLFGAKPELLNRLLPPGDFERFSRKLKNLIEEEDVNEILSAKTIELLKEMALLWEVERLQICDYLRELFVRKPSLRNETLKALSAIFDKLSARIQAEILEVVFT